MPVDDPFLQLRRALRALAARPRASLVIVLCLTLGIGAVSTAFTVIHPVLLRPLPFHEPDRLGVISAYSQERTDPDDRWWVPALVVERLQARSEVLDGVAAFEHHDFDLLVDDRPVRLAGARVIPGSFGVLGVEPLRGRAFEPEDGQAPVAMISEGLWHRMFGGTEEILGRNLTVAGRRVRVIGVVPDGREFPARAELWTPLDRSHLSDEDWVSFGNLEAVGRLASEASWGDLAGELDREARVLAELHPAKYAGKGMESVPLDRYLRGDFRRPLLLLFVAALCVLAVAVANVLNLFSVQLEEERASRGVRMALGASRRRLALDLLTETLILSSAGGSLGLLLAGMLARTLSSMAGVDSPLFDRVGLSPVVASGTAGLAVVVATVLAGFGAARSDVRALDSLRPSRAGSDRASGRVRRAFVAAQVAVALVLLAGGALMVQSFRNLGRVDLGFEPAGQLTVRVVAPPSRRGTVEQRVGFFQELLDQVRSLTGVTAAGATHRVFLADSDWTYGFSVEGRVPEDASVSEPGVGRVVTPGFFRAAGVPVLRGRSFARRDRGGAPGVVIVSRALEARYWPGESAVGKRLKRGSYDNADFPWLVVVGVVEDVHSAGPAGGVRPAIYYPLAQIDGDYLDTLGIVARTDGDPAGLAPEIRAAARRVDRSAIVFRPVSGDEAVTSAVSRERLQEVLLLLFAGLGVFLAIAGVYSVTADAVERRSRELALRVALGARRRTVLGQVLVEAAKLGVLGVVVGAAAAALAAHLLHDLFFGVEPLTPELYLPISTGLLTLVLLAASVPAWRATRTDPAELLRGE
jgi:predicted permease